MRIVAMIPARMGSKRVPKKNLRYLGDKPLIFHIIETLKKSQEYLDYPDISEIYINSEDDIFEEIAEQLGVKFYKRPKYLSSDTATNDEFVEDFLYNIECTHLLQVLPTSPFITIDDILGFINKMQDYDTLISVKNEQISCVFENKPINFNPRKKLPPSQLQTPVKSYATALMGWKKEKFLENMDWDGCAYHNDNDTKIGYYTLSGYSTIDIDWEDDFVLAEAVFDAIKRGQQIPRYYDSERFEVDVESILVRDGIPDNTLYNANLPVASVDDVIIKMKRRRIFDWSHRFIDTENNSATLICQSKGNGNRLHYHPDWNEWWYIIQGKWEWEIDGEKQEIYPGEIVFIEKGKKHKITALKDNSIRLAVSRSDVPHVYEGEKNE